VGGKTIVFDLTLSVDTALATPGATLTDVVVSGSWTLPLPPSPAGTPVVWTPAPGGESFADLVARLSDWLEEWDRTDGPQGTTVVVAHAGSIRATLCRLLGVPLEEAFGFQVDYARVTALSLWGATPTLICRNADRWPDFPPRDDAQQRCPRCGEANECAVAAGKSVSACWCFGARIPRELLADLPEGTRGETCICSRCAAARHSGLPAVHRTIG
jgi:hypothetical protein